MEMNSFESVLIMSCVAIVFFVSGIAGIGYKCYQHCKTPPYTGKVIEVDPSNKTHNRYLIPVEQYAHVTDNSVDDTIEKIRSGVLMGWKESDGYVVAVSEKSQYLKEVEK